VPPAKAGGLPAEGVKAAPVGVAVRTGRTKGEAPAGKAGGPGCQPEAHKARFAGRRAATGMAGALMPFFSKLSSSTAP